MRRSHGSLLVMTIFTISLLLILAILFAGFYQSEKTLAMSSENSAIAQSAADAGLEDVALRLNKDRGWAGTAGPLGTRIVNLPLSGAKYSVNFAYQGSNPNYPGENNNSNYNPYSTDNADGSKSIGFGGVSVPSGMVHIVSEGRFGNSKRISQALMAYSANPFDYGIAVQDQITINGGSLIDSFDSRIGGYDKQHDLSGGNIFTNSHAGKPQYAVDLSGGVNVWGDVTVGPGVTNPLNSINGDTSQYHGQALAATTPMNMPFKTPPAGLTNLGILSIKQNTTIPAGTYLYNSIDIQSAQVNVSGQVTIYVLGNISITGNGSINNTTKDASQFTIIGGPNTTDVQITGKGSKSQELYMRIYAPAADFKLSGNDKAAIYGALVGHSMVVSGGAAIHYDRKLKDTLDFSSFVISSRW
jgi:hypothetical protein